MATQKKNEFDFWVSTQNSPKIMKLNKSTSMFDETGNEQVAGDSDKKKK